MLDRAAGIASGDGRIEWRQADALALPFADQSFDAVTCQFGAMFFPDKVQGYKEARRVLRPGGHFFFNVWGPIADNEFADTVTDALAVLFPHDPPRFMARTPHGYHDVEPNPTGTATPQDLRPCPSRPWTTAARRPHRAIPRSPIARERR